MATNQRIYHDELAHESRSAFSPEFDPYLRLIEAIFAGPYGKSPMHPAKRIEWAQQHLPRTYGMLAWRFHL